MPNLRVNIDKINTNVQQVAGLLDLILRSMCNEYNSERRTLELMEDKMLEISGTLEGLQRSSVKYIGAQNGQPIHLVVSKE